MHPSDILYFLVLGSLIIFTYKIFSNIFGLIVVPKNERNQLHTFYQKHSHYYNQLNTTLQKRFVYRSYSLLRSVKVIGRQGFVVSKEAKLFVLSAMIQLTFGFRYYSMPRFRNIFIYPSTYTSPITGQKHDGEVHARGLIVLSWEKLVKGFANPNDSINLGLHEMAHALMHTIMHTNNHEPGLDEYLEKVLKLSEIEIQKINSGEYHIFRPYASTSIHEFFAVTIEHFFEDPTGLKKNMPNLYKKVCLLLKQDPANKVFVLPNNYNV
jgi:Mlc titration factor MtfA (ptsG expression regulator)